MITPNTLIAVFLVLSFSSFSLCANFVPYDYGFEPNRLLKRQSGGGQIEISRLNNSEDGSIPIRREIRKLKEDSYSWNLFILAMSMMQYANQTDEVSWYQIAGIHGLPFIPWNGVVATPGNAMSGYCTHSSILFPVWHRPYLALLEQILYQHIQQIASWFPSENREREMYLNAAQQWRLPYWDWGLTPPVGEEMWPKDFREEFLYVYGPTGWQWISNPLFAYRFNPLDTTQFVHEGLRSWQQTLRAPSDNLSAAAVSRNDVVAEDLLRDLPGLKQRLYTLFSNYDRYDVFSNKGYIPGNNESTYDSIESIHDVIHSKVGKGGHMYYIIYSAFDPVFFLHHANVDRLFAMWQALHPTSWVVPSVSRERSYTMTVGDLQNATTPLTPFLADSVTGRFWNADSSRDTRVFGYVYEDTASVSLTGPSTEQARAQLVRTINEKYGDSSPPGLARGQTRTSKRSWAGLSFEKWFKKGMKGGDASRENWAIQPDLSSNSPLRNPPMSAIIRNQHYNEWIANVRLKNMALGGPGVIYFFIGVPPDDALSWSVAPNLIGSQGFFCMEGYANPVNEVTATVPLTAVLMRMVAGGQIMSLDPFDMDPYLQKYLTFRVQGAGGTVIDPKTVDGLEIKVVSSQVRAPSSGDELPRWGDVEVRFTMF